MALYKYGQFVGVSQDVAFDKIYPPSVQAPYAGIYRCVACGCEIGIAQGHVLPPQNHHQHRVNQGAIQWRLAVYAVHQT